MQILHRRAETRMAEQATDRQQIDARFQEVRRKTVPQRVGSDGTQDAGLHCRRLADLLNGGRREGNIGRPAGGDTWFEKGTVAHKPPD